MRIESNNLLHSNNKSINFVNDCLIAKEGPNTKGNLSLSNISIEYDSYFSSNMTLQPEDKDMPIMYGFLGTDITFIAITVDYNNNPQVCPEDNYIEYYFEDQPLIRRTFTDILVLSGNDTKRIPQIYVYNPGKEVVNLNIMVANLDINTITSQLAPEYTELVGLTFNSITTDQIYGLNCTGSTQFEILDPLSISGGTGITQMVIPFSKIDILEINNNIITIKTTSDDPIKLSFVSNFYALQAFSKMNWVMEDTINRWITMTYPVIDVVSPVIEFKPNPIISTLPVTKSDLTWRYIDNVKDYDDTGHTHLRDGIINNSDVEILITNNHNGEQLEQISSDGDYTITFLISDLAGNRTSETKQLLIDSTGPSIHFNNVNDVMNLTSSTQTPGTIHDTDINIYYIDNIWDDVDGVIANSAVTIFIVYNGAPVSEITQTGTYQLSFSVSDNYGNLTTETKNLTVTG